MKEKMRSPPLLLPAAFDFCSSVCANECSRISLSLSLSHSLVAGRLIPRSNRTEWLLLEAASVRHAALCSLLL
jgi:hypothetical protein